MHLADVQLTDVVAYTILGLTRGSMYALIALGYTLVYGVLQLINFAHGEVFMVGAFGSYLVVDALAGTKAVPGALVPLVLLAGVAAGALSGGGVAWVVERVAYRPLRSRGAPKLAFLISAIGASFFLSQFAGKVFNRQPNNAFPSFFNADKVVFTIAGAQVTTLEIVIVVSAIAMMAGLDRLVACTKLGRSMRAVAEDAPTAALMGIDVDRTISRTFVIGGLLGGAAGFLFGVFSSFSYQMGFGPGVKAFAAAVLGGIGNLRGAMLGGLLLGLVENWAAMFIDLRWTDVISFVVLVLVLMFRPRGILGEQLGRAA